MGDNIECLTLNTIINIITFNEKFFKFVFNNDLAYDPIIRYRLYNGTYVLQNIPQLHPVAILNYNISGVLTYSGDLSKKSIKMIYDISYDFYYRDIGINLYDPFGTASITCYNYENMRMDNIFNYSIFCNIVVPQTNSNLETNYYVNYKHSNFQIDASKII